VRVVGSSAMACVCHLPHNSLTRIRLNQSDRRYHYHPSEPGTSDQHVSREKFIGTFLLFFHPKRSDALVK